MKKREIIVALGICMMLTGCNQGNPTPDTITQEDTEATTEIVMPSANSDYREIPKELPAVGETVANPGTREHFSFSVQDSTYTFTETETLWLYNQSKVYGVETQFMLNVDGHKVVIRLPESEPNWKDWITVYSDEVVTIYRKEDSDVSENEILYITLYDMCYQVENWSELVTKRIIKPDALYQQLAQMGTAILPSEGEHTVSDVISGLRETAVFEDYTMAYRDTVPYSGFIFCSPSSGDANHDDISIYMSIEVPDWNTYATLHFEQIPDYQDRLEDTGESYDGHPILVDYTGELKYFLIGSDGRCVYLDGVPESNDSKNRNYTAKEAAYIFDLVLTKE